MRAVRNFMSSLRNIFLKHDEIIIFTVAFLIEIAFGLMLIDKYGGTFLAGDSVDHTYIARVAVDNGIYSGLSALTGVWLPMFPLLEIPFVMVDKLYTTGLSGTIVNAAMTGGIAVYIYKIMGDRNNRLAILAPLLFMSNIYTLIYGATPMSEQTALFFLTLACYYFKIYWHNQEIKEFIKCSIALVLGSLSRYELWSVAMFVVFIFLINEIKNHKIHRIAYAWLPVMGIISWLFIEFIITKDPLMFIHDPASAQGLTSQFPPYFKDNLLLTLSHSYAQMYSLLGIGVYLLFLMLIPFIIQKKNELIPYSLFFIPILFQIILMFKGTSLGWLRHFYLMMPLVVIVITYSLEYIYSIATASVKITTNSKLTYITSILFVLFIPIAVISQNGQGITRGLDPWIITGFDIPNERISPSLTVKDVDIVWATDLSNEYGAKNRSNFFKFKNLIGNENVLAPTIRDPYNNRYLSVYAKISPSQIIDSYDYLEYNSVMERPWDYVTYVIIPPNVNDSWNVIYNNWSKNKFYIFNYYFNDDWKSEFLNYYQPIFEDKGFTLFKLKKEN